MLVLNAEDWRRTKEDIKRREVEERVHFIKNLPIFGTLGDPYLHKRLMPNFVDETVNKGAYMFKEGEIADKFYVITDGDFLVTKRTVQENTKVEENVRDIIADPKRHRVVNNQYFSKNCKVKQNNNFIALMTKGKMIGDVELLESFESDEPTTYKVTLQCISRTGSFMSITKE